MRGPYRRLIFRLSPERHRSVGGLTAEHGVGLAERLDMFHFGEDFLIESTEMTYRHFVLVGSDVPSVLKRAGLSTPDSEWSYIRSNDDDVHIGRIPRFGPTSIDLCFSRRSA